eukprot:scaffold1137_cov55-Cyclotella_meneghiniana.AAC.1
MDLAQNRMRNPGICKSKKLDTMIGILRLQLSRRHGGYGSSFDHYMDGFWRFLVGWWRLVVGGGGGRLSVRGRRSV